MISVVLPYWQRQEAADTALASLAKAYPYLDMEVIVVDDGSPQPYRRPFATPWPLRVLRLERKDVALDPCVPLNRGVAAARGELIALSAVEIVHPKPVLGELEQLVDGNTVATAACWAPEAKVWHAHSSVPVVQGVRLPTGSHFHFLTVLHRNLWKRCGGFDEDYRDGAGYEDADFLLRLQRAGARFVLRDDLVVHHPRTGCRSAWPAGAHERNQQLFGSKWC